MTVKRTRLSPKKVEKILVVIQENKKKVKEFMKKTSYEVKVTEGKGFEEIDIKEIVRVHEEEEEKYSDDGADAFNSNAEKVESEEYDSEDFTDESTDDEAD